MKKALLFALPAAIFLLALNTGSVHGQVTALTHQTLWDTVGPHCTIPANRATYMAEQVLGTPYTTDSITVHINFGDAQDSTYKVSAYNLPNQNLYVNNNHLYYSPGTYSTQIDFKANNGLTDTIYGSALVVDDTCGNVTGRLYADNNNNCTFDAGDVEFANQLVEIQNATTLQMYYTWTNANGMYAISVPSGQTYTIRKGSMVGGYTATCPVSGVQTLAVGTGNYVEDFAYQCGNTTVIDLQAGGIAWTYRPGMDKLTYMHVTSDNECNPVPATVVMTLDPLLTYVSTAYGTAPTNVNGQVLTWNVPALTNFNSFFAGMYLHVSNAAAINTSLCNEVVISTTAAITDTNAANNTYTFCAPVVNAFDPNDKAVWPAGQGAQGFIANGTRLNYLVDFQNTGNDTAYNITITDTLDADLDVNSLQFEKSSFPVKKSIVNGNVLICKLDHIMLPDSGINQAASHGFISYSISPKSALPSLTPINNKANIYFDFNEPVVTNVTLNTINDALSVTQVSSSLVKATVYPNPAENQFTVKVAGNFTVTMYDMLGRSMTSQSSVENTKINTANIPSGLYTLKIKNSDGEQTIKVAVQH